MSDQDEWAVFGTPELTTHRWTFPTEAGARQWITDNTHRAWVDGPFLLRRDGDNWTEVDT